MQKMNGSERCVKFAVTSKLKEYKLRIQKPWVYSCVREVEETFVAVLNVERLFHGKCARTTFTRF